MKQDLLGCLAISVQRIQELLQKELKMQAKAVAERPLLTKKMMKKKLAFCKKYLKWTPKQLENVMFSDRFTFHLINCRATKVRRSRGISRCKQNYNKNCWSFTKQKLKAEK